MTYKSEAEITAAFINDGWSKNTSFTELSFDDAREIGKYFADLMLKGTPCQAASLNWLSP